MQLDDTAHILSSAEFFSICNIEQRRMLAFASEWIKLDAGETLFRAGQVSPGAYVLISGELRSVQEGALDKDAVIINRPGTVIGELALITEHPRRASVVCNRDAQLLMVPRSAFSKIMEQFPEIAIKAQQKVRQEMARYVSSIKGAKKISGVG